MTDSNEVSMKNIKAGRDVIGGSKITNHYHLPQAKQLDVLSQKYKEELEADEKTSTLIDELNHYHNAKSEVRDLKTKLGESGFEFYIKQAEELKELVSKLILRHQHYKSAQKIITYLLAEVESIFNAEIRPKLTSVETEAQLKSILREHIENEIKNHLGENVLEIFNRQINGMVFFLTGNCHLEWK